jgi:ribosomal protein L11 methylase PrmA
VWQQRWRRFIAIWRLSGRLDLALSAARLRCQEVVEGFLRAGGRITTSTVEYGGARLPFAPFRGRGLGGVAYLRRLEDFGADVNSVDEEHFVTTLPNGLRFKSLAGGLADNMLMLVERFVDDEYGWLEPAGRAVVDVGANIGDSAIYFAWRGALHVYAFEPVAVAVEAAKANLAANGIDNVTLVQAAVVGHATPGEARQVAFADVLRSAIEQHPNVAVVCKIDCEGCEYDIVSSRAELATVMRSVAQVMIEYHRTDTQPLESALERLGFRVVVAPTLPGIGWIRADRGD